MTTSLWARLDVRHVVALGEVVRTGSFTAAAASLGYTQSAVSQQITRLETVIGHRVVNRSAGGRTVTLTPAGRVLLGHAEALTGVLARIATDVAALAEGTAGILRVGCFESVGSSLLPSALARFTAAFPKVRVVVEELPDDGDLLGLLETGDLDLSFAVLPLPEGPFRVRALMEDPYVLVTAAGASVPAGDGEVDLDDHPDLPLMAYAGMRPVHAIESRLGRPGLRDRVVFRSNHNSTLLGLAAQGYAAAVIPWLGVDHARAGIRIHGLSRVGPRVVGIAWRGLPGRDPAARPLDDAAQGFVDAAEAAARERETHLRDVLDARPT
ncbi:LysR family transcriptional regulator [Pseudonocardia sp. KRD291]|uniref:LysR family transcriptional regulator n=1 Tax=Pseudonocardia sp. KRD291 TaxID=2792007 RepID=UPI001C4A158C|nr:LysR family transcriptional regulator [Pseudonocardia sp. KRD291]MBW0102339.1 LysR family transcriptional regulator [Pseudonocardia sp. KRD291]